MASVGRNEPCPCGSGKKYKRCCLGRDEEARSEATMPPAPGAGEVGLAMAAGPPAPPTGIGTDPLSGLRPYAIVQMVADSGEWKAVRRSDPKQWAMRSIEGVAALSIQELQDRLAEMGIDASRHAFLEAAAGEVSAWEVSKSWLEGRPKSSLPRFAEDFAGLAACRLWKSFLPERPSLEMVDDWMQEGYGSGGESGEAEPCELWWKVWSYIRDRITPAMRRREDADALYGGLQSIFNWSQDFSLALVNASIDRPEWIERGIAYHRELLERFPDDDWLTASNTRADLAELLVRSGRRAEGEAILRRLIEEHPDRALGYCRLADELRDADPDQALAVLLAARDRPVRDARENDLDEQIDDIRALLKERSERR